MTRERKSVSFLMKARGVSTVGEWAAKARAVTPAYSEKEADERRAHIANLTAMQQLDGVQVTDEMLEDEELFIHGHMKADEFRAYLLTKYQ